MRGTCLRSDRPCLSLSHRSRGRNALSVLRQVFGYVTRGMDVLRAIANAALRNGALSQRVMIDDCGQLT